MTHKNIVKYIILFVYIFVCQNSYAQTHKREQKNEIAFSFNYKLLETKNDRTIGIYYKRAFAITKNGYFSGKFIAYIPFQGSEDDFIFSSLAGYNRYFYNFRAYVNAGVASSIFGVYNKFFGLFELGASQYHRKINIGFNSQLFLHPSETFFSGGGGILGGAPGPFHMPKRLYFGLGAFISHKF